MACTTTGSIGLPLLVASAAADGYNEALSCSAELTDALGSAGGEALSVFLASAGATAGTAQFDALEAFETVETASYVLPGPCDAGDDVRCARPPWPTLSVRSPFITSMAPRSS